MTFAPEIKQDEKICQYWQQRTTVESDWVHEMQSYRPTGSPVRIRNCSRCGWIDGYDLARSILLLDRLITYTPRLRGHQTSLQLLDEVVHSNSQSDNDLPSICERADYNGGQTDD